MIPLHKEDLERFSWDKMSPGIDQKIKKKKRGLFIFKIVMFGIVSLLCLFCFRGTWDFKGADRCGQPASLDRLHSDLTSLKTTASTVVMATDSTYEQGPSGGILPSDHEVDGLIKSSLITSSSRDQFLGYAKKSKNSISRLVTKEIIIEATTIPIDYLVWGDDKLIPFDKYSIAQINSSKEINNSNGDIDSYIQIPYVDKLGNKELVAKKRVFSPIFNFVKVFNDSDNDDNSSISVAYIFNTITNHPYAPLLGTGFSLGYSVAIGESQYVGLEYNYQKYKYRFVYPSNVINPSGQTESNNIHELFSIPLFYAYEIGGDRFSIALETGVNFTLLKFSNGRIASLNNSAFIIKLTEENYFRKSIGTRWLLRVKVDYAIGESYGLFANIGSDVSLKNWYKDDSFVIKPIMINIGLGVRRSF